MALPRGCPTLLLGLTLLGSAGCAEEAPDPVALEVLSQHLDLRSAPLGHTVVAPLTVRNPTASPLQVTALARPYSGPFAVCSKSTWLEPGEALTLEVRFTPLDITEAAGRLVLLFEHPLEPFQGKEGQEEITLSGRGYVPLVRLSPDHLAFGPRAAGELAEDFATVSAIDATELELVPEGGVERCEGGSGAAPFCVGDAPAHLASGASAPIRVVYRPEAATGPVAGRLLVRTCAVAGACDRILELSGLPRARSITCEPTDFGGVLPGRCAERRVRCTNELEAPVVIERVALVEGRRPEDLAAFTLGAESGPWAQTVRSGASFEIPLEFCPRDFGAHDALLAVFHDGPGGVAGDHAQLAGTGTGALPCGAPRQLDLGPATTLGATTAPLTVTNCGPSNLTLAARIGAGAADFAIASIEPPLLAPGETGVIEVRFWPEVAGARRGTLIIGAADGRGDELEVELLGEGHALPPCRAELAPASLDFGRFDLGQRHTRELSITNGGSDRCLLRAALAPGAAGAVRLGGTSPVWVEPGAVARIAVTVAGERAGPLRGALELNLFDGGEAPRRVPILAEVEPGAPFLWPSRLDFGAVEAGCSAGERTLRVHAGTGSWSATSLAGVRLEDPSGRFEVTTAGPWVQEHGAYWTLGVRHRRADAEASPGSDAAELVVELSSGGALRAQLIAGRGPSPKREVFTQPELESVDWLLVVADDACSGQERALLARELHHLMEPFLGTGIPHRVGVLRPLAANRSDGGRLWPVEAAPADRMVSSASRGLYQTLASRITDPRNGSSQLQYLSAVSHALSGPLLAGEHQSLLGSEARRAVLFYGAVEDGTAGPVAPWLDRLFATSGGPNRVTVSNMTGPPDAPCSNLEIGGASNAPRLFEATRRAGGEFASICSTDVPADLARLGWAGAGPRRTFYLEAPAEPSTLEVSIDGVSSSPGSGAWTHDAERHAIRFAEGSAPRAGATIEVRYRSPCAPP